MLQKRQVFMNSDGRGIVLLSVAVYSLLKNSDSSKSLDLYIAHDRTFEEVGGLERIRGIVAGFSFAEVFFLDYSPWQTWHGGVFHDMLWAFPLCEKILPSDLGGKMLYIDIDMLIRKDLGPLFDIDLAGQGMIAAAVNESRREHRQYLVNVGWPEEAGYSFNNATCLVDLDAFRREHMTDRMVAWYLAHRDIAINTDQDSQNMMYGARTLRIPIKWNYTDGWLERIPHLNPFAKEWRVFPPRDVLQAALDPYIIHYIGTRKPTQWTHRPERKRFHQAMRELGLSTDNLPGETPVRKLIAGLFDCYHFLIRCYARLLLATVVRRAPANAGTAAPETAG